MNKVDAYELRVCAEYVRREFEEAPADLMIDSADEIDRLRDVLKAIAEGEQPACIVAENALNGTIQTFASSETPEQRLRLVRDEIVRILKGNDMSICARTPYDGDFVLTTNQRPYTEVDIETIT